MRQVLQVVFPILHGLRVAYWRVARPATHGVRVLIRCRGTGAVLLVRHTYGRREVWFPPGGGYNPAREAAADAARREVREEVGIALGPLSELGHYRTEAGGNRDAVVLFRAEVESDTVRISAEIAEARWVDVADPVAASPLAPVARHALTLASLSGPEGA